MENPLITLRSLSSKTQQEIASKSLISKQFISKAERGMYEALPHSYANTLIRCSGIEELTRKELHELQHKWIQWKRGNSVTNLDPLPIVTPPVAAVKSITPSQPNFIKFRNWRESYWPSRYKFSEDFCVRDYDVIRYESGKCRSMPSKLVEALEPFGLLVGFDWSKR